MFGSRYEVPLVLLAQAGSFGFGLLGRCSQAQLHPENAIHHARVISRKYDSERKMNLDLTRSVVPPWTCAWCVVREAPTQ